jgi:hypothetical protein
MAFGVEGVGEGRGGKAVSRGVWSAAPGDPRGSDEEPTLAREFRLYVWHNPNGDRSVLRRT